MVELKPITSFSIDDLSSLGKYGYASNEKYEVEKYAINDELIFRVFKTKLKKAYIREWPIKESDFIRYNEAIKEGYSYGAYLNGSLVGVIVMSKSEWNNTLEVYLIHVSDKHHKKGIGSILLAKAKEVAIKNGFRAIVLETQNTNVNAIEFYKNNGFCIDGIDISLYDNNYPDTETAFIMKIRF